eukprot:1155118-Pelagomonas_calceolata.AAC.1
MDSKGRHRMASQAVDEGGWIASNLDQPEDAQADGCRRRENKQIACQGRVSQSVESCGTERNGRRSPPGIALRRQAPKGCNND